MITPIIDKILRRNFTWLDDHEALMDHLAVLRDINYHVRCYRETKEIDAIYVDLGGEG